MLLQKGLGLSFGVGAVVLLLSGCASSIFPDFADDTQVIIDDGGKVEVRKIDNKGIVVADKENAVYDDEDNSSVFIQDKTVVDEVTPAATVKVETQNLAPVEPTKKLWRQLKNLSHEVILLMTLPIYWDSPFLRYKKYSKMG